MAGYATDNARSFNTITLTPVDETFIRLLAQHHYLTPDHFLTALYQPGCRTSVRARLRKLTDAGYLVALQRRIGGALPGSESRCYTLSSRGRELARSLGEPVPSRFRPSEAVGVSEEVRPHVLAVNFALLAARRL